MSESSRDRYVPCIVVAILDPTDGPLKKPPTGLEMGSRLYDFGFRRNRHNIKLCSGRLDQELYANQYGAHCEPTESHPIADFRRNRHCSNNNPT